MSVSSRASPVDAVAEDGLTQAGDIPAVGVKAMVRLALPAIVASELHHAFRPLDQYFVRHLGTEAQGALGAATFVTIVAYAAFLLISAGAAPLVGRATGAGDPEQRRRIVGEGLAACLLIALGLAVIGGGLAGTIAGALGLTGPTATHAAAYLRTLFLTGGALVVAPLVDATFNAMGRTRVPMVLQGGALALNAVLTPLFLYGLGMGTAGAALGTTLAQTLMMFIGLTLLVQETGLAWRHVRLGPDLRRILSLGAPIALNVALYALVYWGLLATSVSPLGPAVNAGLGIGFSALESLSWPLYVGASVAVASVVGRALGAGHPDAAWSALRALVAPVTAGGVLVWAAFYLGGPVLVGIFAADEAGYAEALIYARILAWSQPMVALEMLFEGVLAGAGDTRKVFWGTVPFNLVRIPMAWAWAFPLGWGAAGIWWTLNVTTWAKAVTKGMMVAEGGWSRLDLD